MLRTEQNELLTRTGPGTPMGEMFRRYWIPALLAEELPENDGAPVRVQLLSERLIAFRDYRGAIWADRRVLRASRRLVVVRPQRGMRPALSVPRLEIRRDRTMRGTAVGTREPAGSARSVKLRSYPLVERGGVLWTYMGPPEHQPGLPEYEFALVPPGAPLRLQAAAVLQLVAGAGGRDRFQPRLLAASRRTALRSVDAGLARQSVQHGRCHAGLRRRGPAGRTVHRGAPQRRTRHLLLADHALVHAVVHHDPAARQPSGARAFLDPDR